MGKYRGYKRYKTFDITFKQVYIYIYVIYVFIAFILCLHEYIHSPFPLWLLLFPSGDKRGFSNHCHASHDLKECIRGIKPYIRSQPDSDSVLNKLLSESGLYL